MVCQMMDTAKQRCNFCCPRTHVPPATWASRGAHLVSREESEPRVRRLGSGLGKSQCKPLSSQCGLYRYHRLRTSAADVCFPVESGITGCWQGSVSPEAPSPVLAGSHPLPASAQGYPSIHTVLSCCTTCAASPCVLISSY